jgi:hypothetical protein
MTLPSSGLISLSNLNTEFARASTASLSFSQSFGGVFAQYGAINRNTTAGQDVYQVNITGSNFAITKFYGYNDVENNYWDYIFDMSAAASSESISIDVSYTAQQLYSNTVNGQTTDQSAGYVDTTTSGGPGGSDVELRLGGGGGKPAAVDITITDPDTGDVLVNLPNEDPNNYSGFTPLCTIYGYQRFQMTLYFHP